MAGGTGGGAICEDKDEVDEEDVEDGGGSEDFVGDFIRSPLIFTGLTIFGLAAGIGGSGGDLIGLPILFELRGLISGGITECLIGGLGTFSLSFSFSRLLSFSFSFSLSLSLSCG